MDIWKILEIEKTKDEAAIRDAYRKKLVMVNPEENQKGFMELRQAYEEALAYSKKPDEEEVEEEKEKSWPDTNIGRFMKRADLLYQDINLRSNEEEWKTLLEDDVCISLETKTEVRDELLTYFMTHDFLPHPIWVILDEKFLLKEYKEELYEIFPTNYINYAVINGIDYEEIIRIEDIKSLGGTDYDGFLSQCYQLFRLLGEKNLEEVEKKFEEISGYNIYHPYVDVVRVNFLLEKEEIDAAYELAVKLLEDNPKDIEILRAKANVYWKQEKYEEIKKLYEAVLLINPVHYNTIIGMGDACLQLKEYEKAKEYYNEAYKINKSDYLIHCLQLCTQELVAVYEKKCQENPEDLLQRIELIRSHYQNGKFKESLKMLQEMEPDEETKLEYAHLTGCNHMYLENYEEALPYLMEWAEGTKKLVDDGTKETKKAMERIGAAYQCIAQTLSGLKRFDEAHEYIKYAVETGLEVDDSYEEDARIYLREKKYEEVIRVCDEILENNSQSFIAHGLRAEALYELDYVRDSLDEWNQYLEISPYNLGAYIKKLECLQRLGEREEIKKILDYLEEQKVQSDSIELWRAILLEEEGLCGEAKKRLQQLVLKAENNPEEFEEHLLYKIYYELARISFNNDENWDRAMFFVEKSLNENPHNVLALNYKAHIYLRKQMDDKAIIWFEMVLLEKPNHYNANCMIADIYKRNKNYEKALSYYNKQLEVNPESIWYLRRGLLYSDFEKYEEARVDYEKAMELDVDDPSAYNNIALTYEREQKNELALEYYKMAVDRIENDPKSIFYRNLSSIYLRLCQFDNAIEIDKLCIERFKEKIDYKNLARSYMLAGRYEEAIEQYEIYGDFNADFKYSVLCNIVTCYLLLGEVDKAEKRTKFSWGNDINEKDRIVSKLSCYLYKNQINKAKWELNKLIRFYLKKDVGSGSFITRLCIEIGFRSPSYKNSKLSAVLSDLKDEIKAIKDEPGVMAHKYCEIATLEMGLGNYEKAMQFINEVFKCRQCDTCDFCGCAEAYFVKAQLLELCNDLQNAFAHYEKACKIDATDIEYRMEYERVKNIFKSRT